jgi:hypothetical protein
MTNFLLSRLRERMPERQVRVLLEQVREKIS